MFIEVARAIALLRAGDLATLAENWTHRLVGLARNSESLISTQLEELPADEKVFMAILEEEMWFYVWMYRSAHSEAGTRVPQQLQAKFGQAQRDPQDDQAVDDFETIVNSAEKLIDKLPGPLKKIAHAMLEVLKLLRGIV